MMGFTTLLYSLPDFALSIKLSKTEATNVVIFLHLSTAIGRPFIGCLSDRFGRITVAANMTLICGLACFVVWLPAQSYGVTVLFALISGAMLGVFWVVGYQFVNFTALLTSERRLVPCVRKWWGYKTCRHYFRCRGWSLCYRISVSHSLHVNGGPAE